MKSFAVVLRDALRKKYGRIPSAAFLAIHFNRCFPEGAPVSQETARYFNAVLSAFKGTDDLAHLRCKKMF
jgi:hypothetical protein